MNYREGRSGLLVLPGQRSGEDRFIDGSRHFRGGSNSGSVVMLNSFVSTPVRSDMRLDRAPKHLPDELFVGKQFKTIYASTDWLIAVHHLRFCELHQQPGRCGLCPGTAFQAPSLIYFAPCCYTSARTDEERGRTRVCREPGNGRVRAQPLHVQAGR